MSPTPIERLLKPRSIAIVGASARPEMMGMRALRNLRRFGFAGSLYQVNPRYQELEGAPCYPSLAALPEVVDAAFIAIPAARTIDIVDECGRIGIRAAVVPSNGFAEAGAEGRVLAHKLGEAARGHGIALCGPNNIGLINVHDRTVMWPAHLHDLPRPGGTALVTQSGSAGIALSQDDRALGFAYLISTGNEAVLTVADYLAFLAREDHVHVILMFLETIRDPAGFAAAAREAAARGKRIVVVKAGESAGGREAVAAHTGALAGEAEVYDAYFRRLGVIRAADLDEMLEMAALLSAYPAPPREPHVASVILSGGLGALLADIGAANGVSHAPLSAATREALHQVLPPYPRLRNPIDAMGLGWNVDMFESVLATLARDPTYGSILLAMDTTAAGGADTAMVLEMAAMCARLAPETEARFVFANNTTAGGLNAQVRARLDAAGIPYLAGMRESLAAIGQWARPPERPMDPPRAAGDWRDRAASAGVLTESGRFRLLSEAGVPMAACEPASSAEAASAAAAKLGYPIAMKGAGPGIAHKTELGLVRLDLADAAAVEAAFRDLQARLPRVPGAEIVVQPIAGPGVELILGARPTRGFGTLVVVGMGGTYVEQLGISSHRLAPLDREGAIDMLDETPLGAILAGARGKGPYNIEAAADAIAAFSRFADAAGDVLASIEINPLIVLEAGHGAVGVDLLMEPAAPADGSPCDGGDASHDL